MTSWFKRIPLVATMSLGASLTATLYVISNFSLVHPYLIADNRCVLSFFALLVWQTYQQSAATAVQAVRWSAYGSTRHA